MVSAAFATIGTVVFFQAEGGGACRIHLLRG
jgi:hypothetical protein